MGLGTLDIILLVCSLLVSLGIGVYYSIKGLKITPLDYLLGNRAMNPLPLAMSLTVGTVSAITIMGNSGEMYTNGTQLWLMDLGMAVGMVFVSRVLIPIFYPLEMVSLYQYIEGRFGSKWFRQATVVLTVFGGIVFIGFLIIPPSLFLARLTGLPPLLNLAITGICCSLYSAFGGVKAVVYTDVFQSIVMIVGALAIVIQGSYLVGGIGEVWNIAYDNNRVELFNFDLNPYQRHSFWLVLVYGFFFSITTYGVNQNQTQRAFCTGSVENAQKVINYTIAGILILKGLFNFTGIVMFANYVGCDPLTEYGKPLPNLMITVIYVTEHLTKIPGLSGLFVSAIYAAVLSSVSTQVNSITALIWEDFLKTLHFFHDWSDYKVANFQKIIALVTGVSCILISVVMSNFQNFLRAVFSFTGAIWSPILGLFIVALFLPWIGIKGAAPGFILGIIVSLWIVIGQQVTDAGVNIYLPSSREDCPIVVQNINNITEFSKNSNFSEGIIIRNVSLDISKTDLGADNKTSNDTSVAQGFYGISYCLNHVWGALACVVSAIAITICTGSNKIEDVKRKLIHPFMWKIFYERNIIFSLKRIFGCHQSADISGQDLAEELNQQIELKS